MPVTKEIKVEGMHCGGCETIIEEAMGKIDGVQTVKANFVQSSVKVCFNPDKTSLVLIQEACAACGYPTATL